MFMFMSASADPAGSLDLITPIALMVWLPCPDARPSQVDAQGLHASLRVGGTPRPPFPPGALDSYSRCCRVGGILDFGCSATNSGSRAQVEDGWPNLILFYRSLRAITIMISVLVKTLGQWNLKPKWLEGLKLWIWSTETMRSKQKQTHNHDHYNSVDSGTSLWRKKNTGGHPPSPYQSAHPFPEPQRKYSRHTHPPWFYENHHTP